MANFPTSLDTLTNPTANDTLAAVPHHTQHGTANDILEAIEAKLGIVASTPVLGDTLVGTATGSSKWVQGIRTLRHYGTAVGDGVADDTAAVSAADAATGAVYVPTGIYDTTIALGSLAGPFWGNGQIRTAANNLLAPNHTTVAAPPSSNGNWTSILTAFNGDLSNVHSAVGHLVSGATTLGQPTTGYRYTEECYPFLTYLYNESGYNHETDGNDGRTGVAAFRTVVYQAGQGDAIAYNAAVTVGGTRAGSTDALANPAGVVLNGSMFAIADGVYLNAGEFSLDDQGNDVSAIGWVVNLGRSDATGAKAAWWQGFRVQSQGTEEIDVAYGAKGPMNIGLDLSFAVFPVAGTYVNAAITLAGAQRIYLNATASDATGNERFPSATGSVYIDYSSSRINLAGADVGISAANIVTDTTTGMKIGTSTSQKLGFFNATPIVQPSGVAVSAAGIHAALVSLGLIAA